MKAPAVLAAAAVALICTSTMPAAETHAPSFGGEKIGVPPLSLRESLANNPGKSPHTFRLPVPTFSETPQREISPQLLPRNQPGVDEFKAARAHRAPKVSRVAGMPVIEPDASIDHKLTVVPPDPNIDFKLLVRDPIPPVEESAQK